MIYPEKIKTKKGEIVAKSLMAATVVISIVLLIINKITSSQCSWAIIVIATMIYAWITVMFSIKKNANIAGHVLLQTFVLSLLVVFIDYKLGFRKWSLNIAIPIIVIIANGIMMVLTIISHKNYIKYAIYQLIILVFSILPIIFIEENMVKNIIISKIAIVISLINLIITLALSAKDVKEVIIRKFHI